MYSQEPCDNMSLNVFFYVFRCGCTCGEPGPQCLLGLHMVPNFFSRSEAIRGQCGTTSMQFPFQQSERDGNATFCHLATCYFLFLSLPKEANQFNLFGRKDYTEVALPLSFHSLNDQACMAYEQPQIYGVHPKDVLKHRDSLCILSMSARFY